MNGEQLYALYAQKNLTVMNCDVEAWDFLEVDDQAVWNAMAETIGGELDPSVPRRERFMTREQFTDHYFRNRSSEDRQIKLTHYQVLPCYCSHDSCLGWALILNDSVDDHMGTHGVPG